MSIFQEHEHVKFVNNGDTVVVAVGEGRGLICVVEQAHGNHAFVVNEEHDYRRMVSIYSMYPHALFVERLAAKKKTNLETKS